MSSHEPVIDPALRDLPPPSHAAGVKRKARAPNASPTPSSIPQPQDRGRVTRRSAALLSAAQHPTSTSPSDKPLTASDIEPSRGEEENKYQWTPRDSAKRSRHRSPSTHAASGSAEWSARAINSAGVTVTPPTAPLAQGTNPSSTSHSPSHGGIDNLAAAATAAFQSNPRPQLPYPFGLTPFRYHCLTPHLPQPPPGDPNNPAFSRFDPSEGSQQQLQAAASMSVTSASGTSRRTSGQGGLAGSVPTSRPPSRPPSRGRPDDQFMSFSTLLAASEAYSTGHTPAAESHPPSYFPSPERGLPSR